MSDLTNIQKRFNKSYIESQKLLKEIYELEYKFQLAKNNNKNQQKHSNSAHDAKDKLNHELNNIMSLNMRGRNTTRKRSRNNSNLLFLNDS
jgi:uncharacterized phage infection (PIP) family protein YhgE